MLSQSIRYAYLENQLTYEEALISLDENLDRAEVDIELVRTWDLIKGLQAELAAVRREQEKLRMPTWATTGLVSRAYELGELNLETAVDYLRKEGWSELAAKGHLDTLKTIRDRDAERAAYLEDPDHAPRYCTRCGKETPRQQLSNRGICQQCGWAAVSQAGENLIDKHGPVYEKWREGMLQAMYHLESELLQESREREPSTLGDMIDHDKAPPCQNDCYDCPDEDCSGRVEPYVEVHDEARSDVWWCPNCRMHLDGTWARCPTCGTWQPGQEPK